MKNINTLALSLLLSLFGGSPILAQAQFLEDFDDVGSTGPSGPSELVNGGWIFRNQSNPIGSSGWSQGLFFTPQSGGGYLGTDSLSTDFFGGQISSWVLLPQVAAQQAGDILTLHLRSVASSNADTIQILYSPGGGTSTGAGSQDVGDFTTLLQDVDPMPTSGWQLVSVTIPGDGRLALRYFVSSACNFACFGSSIGIDTLSIGDPPPPPCSAFPPAPGPGETVTWTAAGGPWQVCNDLMIPAGATVVIEAGATVTVDPLQRIIVEGTLIADGTAVAPVFLDGPTTPATPPIDVRGMADLRHSVVTLRVHADTTGTILVSDCSFSGGVLSADAVLLAEEQPFVGVTTSTFVNSTISVTDGALAVRHSDFLGGGISLLRGHLVVESVTMDGGTIHVLRERYGSPIVVDGVTITNNPTSAALILSGYDYFVGPSNLLTNNLYPLELSGGLLAGSSLPSQGNLNDYVYAPLDGLGGVKLSALDVPYVVDHPFSLSGAPITIGPGATLLLTPDTAFAHVGAFRALGTPAAPITFAAFSPSPWDRLMFVSNVSEVRFEHCIFEGARTALQADDSLVQADSCVFQDNEIGGLGTTFGLFRARGSQFLANDKGVRSSTGTGSVDVFGGPNPNAFVGNLLAVEANNSSSVAAAGNWWGDPSGPQHPTNPGGTGDIIGGPGASSTTYQPFLTTAPDFSDSPPVVRVVRPFQLLDVGAKILITWSAEDDSRITSQRIFFSQHGRFGYVPVAMDLRPGRRSYTWTVPPALPSSNNNPSWIKVVAIDDQGQEGYDERQLNIPFLEDVTPANFAFVTPLEPVYEAGDTVDFCYSVSGASGTMTYSVLLDGDEAVHGLGGGHTGISCIPLGLELPWVSTDTARVVMTLSHGAGNRTEWFFSDTFAIRPDPLLGDAPPTVTLITPAEGAGVPVGVTVPITWTASDDRGIRSAFVQASYDGGRTWHRISDDLPPAVTRFDWALPPGILPNARVRVVVRDTIFQNSSDTHAIAIGGGHVPKQFQ